MFVPTSALSDLAIKALEMDASSPAVNLLLYTMTVGKDQTAACASGFQLPMHVLTTGEATTGTTTMGAMTMGATTTTAVAAGRDDDSAQHDPHSPCAD